MAAVMTCGKTAALSHLSAAMAWGMLKPGSGPTHVTVPSQGGRARRSGVRIHRSLTLLPSQTTRRHNIPVTNPARTLADLRRVLPRTRWEAVLAQAEYLRLPVDQVFDGDRTRSEPEARLLWVCRRYRLPMPEVNVPLGPYTVDFLWREERLIVETDAYGTHGGRAMFHADRARDAQLKRQGFEVLRVTDRWLDEAPTDVAATIRELLGRRQPQDARVARAWLAS